ncbi:DNA adenine methylase [Lysinibacillus sphaericus]|uniref:site-specific DNA-methyltransferase (adenine-specific) n=1 Tax=Lysinibacillus sphaericus (strain C3-41) TaxID=444177 RepID=B1I0H5_LYSSC|nr:DNA adenine methylase [Lysinibacillus sphaericus]ACA42334.1 DNA-methyltransferase [Lysinibacillus sphaericus C3-41]MDR0161387.1 DNA adenine methylase [Lysinibacillus sphaericus]
MKHLEAEHCSKPNNELINTYNKLQEELTTYQLHDISDQHLRKHYHLKLMGEKLDINSSIFIPNRFMCDFCSTVYDSKEELDHKDEGFWCEACDGFTYFNHTRPNHDRFILILEDPSEPALKQEYKTDIKLSSHLSPLRYPGGKSKLVNYLYSHLSESKRKTLYSPFVGGGSYELALLHSEIISQLKINDLDYGVFSLWWTMLHMPSELIYRIQNDIPSRNQYFAAQRNIKNKFKGQDMIEAAWDTLLVNRLAFSGIPKAHPLGGKNGTQSKLLARWSPKTLIKRIQAISEMADKITITCQDAYGFVEEAYWDTDGTIFVDPPYVSKGEALYNHYYTATDHKNLAFLLNHLYQGMPGADIIVTYDYNRLITDSYEYQTESHVIGRKYSI